MKDKADRATAEQVMDPRTRMILFKLLSRGMLSNIDGCISTGKEANVYHAIGNESQKKSRFFLLISFPFQEKTMRTTLRLKFTKRRF